VGLVVAQLGHALPMTSLRKRTQHLDLPDAQQLLKARDTVLDAVHTARDRAAVAAQQASDRTQKASKHASKRLHQVRRDAPSASDLARDVRRSQAVEVGVAAASAIVPVIASAWSEAAKRKAVQRAIALAPVARKASKANPTLRVIGVVLTIGGAGLAARRVKRERDAARAVKRAEQMSLDDDVSRMDSEGPRPGSFEHAAANLLDSRN
jgi:hypothetical protein